MPRIVGLDIGERRIGIAVSDPSCTLATPWGVIRVTGLDGNALARAAETILRLAAEDEGVAEIVIGLPKRLDGSPNAMTPRVERFAERIRRRTGIPVILRDERLTSREADARLGMLEPDWRKRKARLDAAAAAIILQEYLDERPRSAPVGGDLET